MLHKLVFEEVQELMQAGYGYEEDLEGALYMVLERKELAKEITAEQRKELSNIKLYTH